MAYEWEGREGIIIPKVLYSELDGRN